ncbi:protein STPG3-like isoform X2 [Rhopilema esculentum]|uniref:protein STPG3-like isoform X2 n=1 Tax=Rhopilema esculentum TaxID=499914 RepID=UPI0031E326A9
MTRVIRGSGSAYENPLEKTGQNLIYMYDILYSRRKRIQASSHNQERVAVSLPGLKECLEYRPPLNTDLTGPTIYSYETPRDKPEMTSFPSFTMRPKTQTNRDGGDRTAWGKEWFSHNYVWLQKADYDPRIKWPSPAHYDIPAAVGHSSTSYNHAPSFSFGKRSAFSLTRKGLENEPSPNAYNFGKSKDHTMNKNVAFTIREGRKKGTVLWRKRESVPGPGSYEISTESKYIKPRRAAFSFATSPRKFDLKTRYTL